MHTTLVLFWLALAGQTQAIDDLALVRRHYDAAAYEEALAHVGRLGPDAVSAEIEQVRALCLLALGRTSDGEQAFERLIRKAPAYLIPERDVSPRMYATFRGVRRRVLPLVARDIYAAGRASFDDRRYDAAVTQLRELLNVLEDPDASSEAGRAADFRLLAEGFIRLAEAEMAVPSPAAAVAAGPRSAQPGAVPSSPATTAGAAPPRSAAVPVYSDGDLEVVPPVEISRFMPAWSQPWAMRWLEYRGEIEIVIDQAGQVLDARMLRPTIPSYDAALISATERWRFEPALLQGQPVRYRLRLQIVLSARQ